MPYTSQPATKGAAIAQYAPHYPAPGSDYYDGLIAGQGAVRAFDPEAARRDWNLRANQFQAGIISPDYWFGYQQGAGVAGKKPGYPGAR